MADKRNPVKGAAIGYDVTAGREDLMARLGAVNLVEARRLSAPSSLDEVPSTMSLRKRLSGSEVTLLLHRPSWAVQPGLTRGRNNSAVRRTAAYGWA
jgi:hypothetical protein